MLLYGSMYIFQCRSLATLSIFLKNELWTQKKEEKKRKPELRCNIHSIDLDWMEADTIVSSLFPFLLRGWDKHCREWLHDCADTHGKAVSCGTIFTSIPNVSLKNTIVCGMKGEVVTDSFLQGRHVNQLVLVRRQISLDWKNISVDKTRRLSFS